MCQPELLQNFGNSVCHTLPVSFGEDAKSRRSLLSGAYARGSKGSHTGGKCVSCRGLHNPEDNTEINHPCVLVGSIYRRSTSPSLLSFSFQPVFYPRQCLQSCSLLSFYSSVCYASRSIQSGFFPLFFFTARGAVVA